MKTENISNLHQLRAYRADLFQRQADVQRENRTQAPAEAPADSRRAEAGSAADTERAPRELSKGRHLDVYG